MESSPPDPARAHAARWLALVWLGFAIVLFEPMLERSVGLEVSPKGHLPFALASGAFLLLAIVTWIGSRRRAVRRCGVAALSLCFLGPPVAELVLRASFLFPSSPTREPIRYAHNLIHDDYWLLTGRWQDADQRIAPRRIQPRLGWSKGPITDEDPLGLGEAVRSRLVRDGRPKVLFYGDSYVAGHSSPENRIPRYLDDRILGADVIDMGVGGYGTGQSYLLYEATHRMVDRPFVIMSAMVYDLDRSTLRVRSYQKPRIRLHDARTLVVTNTPIDPDPDRYYRETPLALRSFVLAAFRMRYFELVDPLFPEKLALNRALLAETKALAAEHGSELLFVLFHPLPELLVEDYRSTFFLETLEELGIDTFDTRDPLLDHVAATGIDPGALYVTGHHNDLGNRVIGDALIAALAERGLR